MVIRWSVSCSLWCSVLWMTALARCPAVVFLLCNPFVYLFTNVYIHGCFWLTVDPTFFLDVATSALVRSLFKIIIKDALLHLNCSHWIEVNWQSMDLDVRVEKYRLFQWVDWFDLVKHSYRFQGSVIISFDLHSTSLFRMGCHCVTAPLFTFCLV